MSPELAILVERMGPYHTARFRAVAQRLGGRLKVVEVAGRSQRYRWNDVGAVDALPLRSLFPDADYEELGPSAIRAAVRAALDKLHPDVVAVNGWGFSEAREAAAWARRTRKAVVLMSDSQERDARRWWPKEVLKRMAVKRCDAALVAGGPHAQYAEKLGMARNRIVLGYDVVDNDHFARGAKAARTEDGLVRAALGLPERFWLACGRFVPKKNLLGGLEAYASYAQLSGPRAWGLVVVGDGPERPALEGRVASLGLQGRVLLPGFVQYPELPRYYGLASAFLLPSVVEQWGLVVNEAMAAGLPVMVSDACGCASELVHEGVNGFTFAPGDAEALSRRMVRLTERADLQAMGEASQRIIASWTPETFARNMERAMTMALEHASARDKR